MKRLLSCPGKIKELLAGRLPIIFLDFDGTLVNLAPTPEEVWALPGLKRLLRRLIQRFSWVVIVSGRAASDVKKRIGLSRLIYVGNHGLEILGRAQLPIDRAQFKKYRLAIKKVKQALVASLLRVPGIYLQDKDVTLSVHYRLAPARAGKIISRAVEKALRPWQEKKILALGIGKKVWEIKPDLPYDKGTAVAGILNLVGRKLRRRCGRSAKLLPIYLGDDKTDEDAFAVVRRQGLAVLVGRPRRSKARYWLKNPAEVSRFLSQLLVWSEK